MDTNRRNHFPSFKDRTEGDGVSHGVNPEPTGDVLSELQDRKGVSGVPGHPTLPPEWGLGNILSVMWQPEHLSRPSRCGPPPKLQGSHSTLCRSPLQGPSCCRSRDHPASSPLPNQQKEQVEGGAPEESHSLRHQCPRAASVDSNDADDEQPKTREQRAPEAAGQVLAHLCPAHPVPPTASSSHALSLNIGYSDANKQSFDGQTLQDSTQIGAQESTTHGPKWSLAAGLREGME